MALRDSFRAGIRWQVGSGYEISFWHDNWVFQSPLLPFKLDSAIVTSEKVNDFISELNTWNLPKLSLAVHSEVVVAILSIPLPDN